ncbi:MAG TPA: hypothetical protein VH878_08095 [Thermodesulfobacteriota bacterium]
MHLITSRKLISSFHKLRQIFFAWKWVIIALHGALYGFAVSACTGSNPYTVTMKKHKPIDTVKIKEDGTLEVVKGELIDFNEALDR